jgi:hypothetical protein
MTIARTFAVAGENKNELVIRRFSRFLVNTNLDSTTADSATSKSASE